MYVLPIWYLPMLVYAMWMGVVFRPIAQAAGDTVVKIPHVESTPV